MTSTKVQIQKLLLPVNLDVNIQDIKGTEDIVDLWKEELSGSDQFSRLRSRGPRPRSLPYLPPLLTLSPLP